MNKIVKIVRERNMISLYSKTYSEIWRISHGDSYWHQGPEKSMNIQEVISFLISLESVDKLHIWCNSSYTYDFLKGTSEDLKPVLLAVPIKLLVFESYLLPEGDWKFLLDTKNIQHVESNCGIISGLTNLSKVVSLVDTRSIYK